MIRVKNTVELQENYKLSDIADSDEVMVYGGLYDKEKYNLRRYRSRVTYSGRDIKQIIVKMQEIESVIPNDWSKIQKAKFIYERLGKSIDYDFDDSPLDQQNSNLTVLLRGKGICAGYALLYKEMMDRQGIECDYVRGVVPSEYKEPDKHAWNTITIDGETIPVDLTWDSVYIKDAEGLAFFGTERFNLKHFADKDERQYDFTYLDDEDIEEIDTKIPKKSLKERKLDLDSKRVYVENALNETYKKFSKTQEEKDVKKQCSTALLEYMKFGTSRYFTNDNNVRDDMVNNVTKEDMLKIVSSMYIENLDSKEADKNISFDRAVMQKLYDTNVEKTTDAMFKYINDEDKSAFEGSSIESSTLDILKGMSNEVVNNYVKDLQKAEKVKNEIKKKSTYDSYELATIDNTNVFQKFFNKIKGKLKNVFKKEEKNKISQEEKINKIEQEPKKEVQNENIQREYSPEDIEKLEKIANEEYVPKHSKDEDEIERK